MNASTFAPQLTDEQRAAYATQTPIDPVHAPNLTQEVVDGPLELTKQQILELSGLWANQKARTTEAAAKEMMLRKRLVKATFPNPADIKVGTNTYDFGIDRWKLKYQHTLNIKFLKEDYDAAKETLRNAGITPEGVVKWVLELDEKAYKALPEDKQKIFADACLEIKDGSPQIKIEQAKRG